MQNVDAMPLVKNFSKELKNHKYNGHYFVRSAVASRICDQDGWFKCQGVFNQENCPTMHLINPYGSKVDRIIFSTWNFDHV